MDVEKIPTSSLPGLTIMTELLYAFAQTRFKDVALSFDTSFTDISLVGFSIMIESGFVMKPQVVDYKRVCFSILTAKTRRIKKDNKLHIIFFGVFKIQWLPMN